jgi:hypothetical protein
MHHGRSGRRLRCAGTEQFNVGAGCVKARVCQAVTFTCQCQQVLQPTMIDLCYDEVRQLRTREPTTSWCHRPHQQRPLCEHFAITAFWCMFVMVC